jgi:hypothetical protein
MRQRHRAGEQRLVAEAGPGLPVGSPPSGEGHAVAMGVAGLGASHSPEAAATWPQSLPDWSGAPGRTCAALGGGPAVVVPDPGQAAGPRAHRAAPASKRPEAALAPHEGLAILPARAAQPREKAQGEVGGQGVARGRRARLRPHPCGARAAVQAARPPLVPAWQAPPGQTRPGSRQPLFATMDRPALRPLPGHPDAEAAWQPARGNRDSHVEGAGHSSAVPSALGKPPLAVRRRAQGVARFPQRHRVARPRRAPLQGRPSTGAAPRPTAQQRPAAWTPPRRRPWAAHRGPATAPVVATLLAARPPPPPGFRSWCGSRRRGQSAGAARLEAACQRARALGACA